MLSRLSIQNFKRFRKLELGLRPLTVLTGTNGGGKTSVIHSLLLARQASSGSPPPDAVELNGPFGLQLGEAQDVLHLDADPSDAIVFGLDDHRWELGASSERSLNLEVLKRPASPPAALSGAARRFTYLSAERLGPRDVLGASSVSQDDLHVGFQGEFTAQVLAVLDQRFKVSEKRLHPESKAKRTAPALRPQVEAWLSSIARPVTLDAQWLPGSNVTLIRYGTPGNPQDRVRPTNMGFGVTYALPVVVGALMAPADSLLLVENPEAHLHPRGQSAIGAFLARLAADGVQVVIETHSDHVINGVRRAVAELNVLDPAQAVVHFFQASDADAPDVQSLELSAKGELSEWPKGFFDQIDSDLAILARARRR
jgi:predicted ATPase